MAVTAAGAKYPMYAYIANLDEFFSYDWMFLEALHAINPEVLFHFKFYDRLKYGTSYDSSVSSLPVGSYSKTETNTLLLVDKYYNPADIQSYCGKNNWVDYISEPYRCYSESDRTQWIKDPDQIPTLTLDESLYINYADYLGKSSQQHVYTLNTSPIQGQLSGILYNDLGRVGNYSTNDLYKQAVTDWSDANQIIPAYSHDHPTNVYSMMYDDSAYNHNGKYTYLVVHVDAFKNKLLKNSTYSVSSADLVSLDSAGSWVTATTFDSTSDTGGNASNVIDNQNLFYLIPIDNYDRVSGFTSASVIYKNNVSWLISAISKQQIQISVNKGDGTIESVAVPAIFTDIQQYVVGKIVIDTSPLELGMASMNSELFHALDSDKLFLTDVNDTNTGYTGNGLIALIFSIASSGGISTIAIPAIIVGENGINLIEHNYFSSFSSLPGLNYIYHFTELLGKIPQSSWTIESEPMLYSPAHLKHEWKVDGKQAPIITSDMIDFENFLIKPWKIIKKLQANDGSCQWKYEFQDVKHNNFPWDDMESQLTVQETRQSPMAIDGQVTAYYSNALTMNQSVYAYAKNNDFSVEWTRIQNQMASQGAGASLAGGLVSGAGTGAAAGAKNDGGIIGAAAGAVAGITSGLISGITNIAATNLENENRNEQLALNQNIAQSQNAYQNLALAQAVNKTMSIPVSIAPLAVRNTELVGEKNIALRNTYREPDITRETALLRWQHLGYPYGMKAHFADYDNRVNYNVVTVDWLNKEHYIKESVFTWLENNLAQKSLFLFADETCLTLLAKLTGFYRLWHVVPSIDSGVIDAQIRASNIEHTLVNKIASGEVNSDGLPVLRPWPNDYIPWWKQPHSDVVLTESINLSLNGDRYVYDGLSNQPFNSEQAGNKQCTGTWSIEGDVIPSSIRFEVISKQSFPYNTTDPAFDNNLITPTLVTQVDYPEVPSVDSKWIARAYIALHADPMVDSGSEPPSDIYHRKLASVAVKISWMDSTGSSHSKNWLVDCIPNRYYTKQLRDLQSGDLVSSITFQDYADYIDYSDEIDPGVVINFHITVGENSYLAMQTYSWGVNEKASTTDVPVGRTAIWCDAAQWYRPLMWSYNYSWGPKKKWQNFLCVGKADNNNDFNMTTESFQILQNYGYLADLPYTKITLKDVNAHVSGDNTSGSAHLATVTFGIWTAIPTATSAGTFEPMNVVVDVITDNDRKALSGGSIPCIVEEVE